MKTVAESWPECIGIAVREWRTAKLGTQTEAAKSLHLDQSTLSKIESGKQRPDYEVLYDAGCSIDALFNRAVAIALRDGVRFTEGPKSMLDKNGVPVTIGAKVRFTGDLLGGRWVEGWVRYTGEHTYYHPRRTLWEARVDNGDRESEDFATNGASIAAWVVSEDIEVVS